MERTQTRPRVDAELLDQPLPAVAVAGQRIGLTAVTVESEHQLPEQPLVERLGGDGLLQAGYEHVMATESERNVDSLGPRGPPLVAEPRRRRARISLEHDIGQHLPTPPASGRLELRLHVPDCTGGG